MNEVQEKVAELRNRVAEFLLVIAKVVKDPEGPLAELSQDVMEELEGLKEYAVATKFSHFIILISP